MKKAGDQGRRLHKIINYVCPLQNILQRYLHSPKKPKQSSLSLYSPHSLKYDSALFYTLLPRVGRKSSPVRASIALTGTTKSLSFPCKGEVGQDKPDGLSWASYCQGRWTWARPYKNKQGRWSCWLSRSCPRDAGRQVPSPTLHLVTIKSMIHPI